MISNVTKNVAVDSAIVHPWWLRLTHWINALAIIVMVSSGWRIYNASPLFSFSYPDWMTLGGWLAGALQWHFAAMWLIFFNGLFYLLMNIVTGRFKRKFWPLSISELLHDIGAALSGKLSHTDLRHYNMVQRFLYLLTVLALIILVLSGLVLWKSVQFPLLRELLGGYPTARYIHFFAMTYVVFFTLIHLAMVILVPRTLLAMIRGR
ncbi:prokaryotic cytochrome b561 family protein [Yersinia ruckeri]|uniref:cytochrome b/b6 domain-containing protein n=1 Tax=Yersinia ruckeri TaxID=29486 RepID=UPI0005ACEB8D|nr:cytochrome b/b6 domain-containing protein [Yersinia ruckeri]AJI93793.1 prokaryotic cytochrome b561 family protein [Yersinia ruckeri]MCW6568612.1 cytochrome b/b6 domain-containing protein [Yersinia ruckeri]